MFLWCWACHYSCLDTLKIKSHPFFRYIDYQEKEGAGGGEGGGAGGEGNLIDIKEGSVL